LAVAPSVFAPLVFVPSVIVSVAPVAAETWRDRVFGDGVPAELRVRRGTVVRPGVDDSSLDRELPVAGIWCGAIVGIVAVLLVVWTGVPVRPLARLPNGNN
jgi:hypothetical protein